MYSMELLQAKEIDFDRITDFYRRVIEHTEGMERYACWKYGLHPTDQMIRRYIQTGAMYYCEKDGAIIAAVALTPSQGEDYHGAAWSQDLPDDEVAVVHILCVDPRMQKQMIAKKLMAMVISLARGSSKGAVRLDALACNVPAQHLYEALGFSRRGKQRWHTENVGWTDFFLYEFPLTEEC